jgi:hypothetical protein
MPNAVPANMTATTAGTRKTNNVSKHNTPGPITFGISANSVANASSGSSIPTGVKPTDLGPFPGFEIDAYN